MNNPNQFFTGYKLLIIEHPNGLLDKDDCIGLYMTATERLKQRDKVDTDYFRLMDLSDAGKYVMVIRDRIADKADRKIRIDEFPYIPDGWHNPVFESEAIIWRHGASVTISEMLQEVQEQI